MDRSTEWPWSWEEEVEWKAELEERDYDLLEELIDSAVEDGTASPTYVFGPPQEERVEGNSPEKYSVTV